MKSILAVAVVAGMASAASAATWDSGTGLGFFFTDNTTNTYNFNTTGISGAVSRVDLYLSPLHTWRGDVTIGMTAPDASTLALIATRAGGSSDLVSIFFSDSGIAIPTSGNIDSATDGTLYQAGGGSLSTLNASDGSWSIALGDFAGGDTGTVDRIVITTVPGPASLGLLGLGGLVATRRRRA